MLVYIRCLCPCCLSMFMFMLHEHESVHEYGQTWTWAQTTRTWLFKDLDIVFKKLNSVTGIMSYSDIFNPISEVPK
jgi:hypothetical protein